MTTMGQVKSTSSLICHYSFTSLSVNCHYRICSLVEFKLITTYTLFRLDLLHNYHVSISHTLSYHLYPILSKNRLLLYTAPQEIRLFGYLSTPNIG